MAIVNSLAIGKSVKSAGNLTYKTVRGRTIASQRITTNKSNTIAQAAQRGHFSACSQAMTLIAQYINVCYEKSRYGSSRNAFFRENPNFNLAGLVGEIKEGVATLADGFLLSLQGSEDNTSRIGLVSKGTLPCIISAATSVRASFTYAEQNYTNILAYSSPNDGITVNLSSPAAPHSVSIAVFGFGKNGLATAIGKYDDGMPSPLFEGNTNLSAFFDRSRFTVDPTSKFITSIQIAAELDPAATSAFGCIVAVPVVGGRTITSSAVFLPPAN